MNFDWSEYLRLAKTLAHTPIGTTPDEAALRSAISRAYYTAFCSARNFLQEQGELRPLGTGEDHRRVKDHLLNSLDRDRRKVGNWLERLLDNRHNADYDNELKTSSISLAQYSVELAEKILDSLAKL